ncbi:unnamed protein product [Oikopleura dioica]|uniref:Uncharacterized protein n=1 Tax=Oikopleura dioica TaxID=34765 RepID=E4WT72_OIKDI|nr:unnamed protein product [Oikopleura dioica]
MNKSMNLPGQNVSTSESLQFKILVKKRNQKPRRKIFIIMTTGCILMAIGLALTIIHFTTEDILGLEKAKKKYFEAQKTAEAQVVFKSNSINLSEIKDDPDQLTKYTAVCFENNNFLVIFFKLRVQESMLEDYGVDIPSITINPLDLPFFMASTIVVSFGIVFMLIATTWWRIVVDKENRKSKG